MEHWETRCQLLPAPIDTVSRVDDGNVDPARVRIKRKDNSSFLHAHSEKSFPWFVQALDVYCNHFTIKSLESSSYNFNYEDILKMVFCEKFVRLTGKIERPVH